MTDARGACPPASFRRRRVGRGGRWSCLLIPALVLPQATAPSASGQSVHESAVPAIQSGHIIVEPQPGLGMVSVSEVWTVAAAPVDAQGPIKMAPIRLELPEGAADLQLDEETLRNAVLQGSALVDRSPVGAAGRQLVLQYSVPYGGTAVDLDRLLEMDLRSFRVMVVGQAATIHGTGLGRLEAEQVGGQDVIAAEGGPLTAGTNLSLRVGGLPKSAKEPQSASQDFTPRTPNGPDRELITVLGLVMALLGGLAVVVYPSGSRAGRLRARPEAYGEVVAQIAALDDLHARGSLSDGEHAARRVDLLRRALDLVPGSPEESP